MDRLGFAVVLCATLIFGVFFIASPTGSSWAAFPSASGKIAFASNRDGKNQIYVMNADGSLQTRLTMDEGSDDHPAWSPDGKQIAFDSNRDGDRDIYVMNADGSEVAQLTRDPDSTHPASDSFPAWSPDGKQIAFQSDRECIPRNCLQTEVYVMSADGSQQTRLTMHDMGSGISDQHPAWSPDGKQIAFDSNRDGDNEIYVLNVANPVETKQLTYNVKIDDMFPAWSPDAKKIAYQSTQWNIEVWVMNADGGDSPGHTVIPRDWGAMVTENAAWSPDASLILFDSYRDDPAGKQREIYVTTADGGEPQRLTFSSHDDSDPNWQPFSTTQSTAAVTARATVTATATVAVTATATVTAAAPLSGTDSFSLLAPYLAIAAAIVVIIALAFFVRRRKSARLAPPVVPSPLRPSGAKPPSGKFCINCGAPLSQGAPFCGKCGSKQ